VHRGVEVRGVEMRREDAEPERHVVDDSGVRAARSLVDGVLAQGSLLLLPDQAAGRAGELGQAPGDEPVLERRHERDPDDGEGAEHDDAECKAEPCPDAPEGVQPRNRYPTPRTVWISSESP